MPAPDYAATGLPYEPAIRRMLVQVVREPMRTEFDRGEPRARQHETAVNARITVGEIEFTAAQVETLYDFIINDLKHATVAFTMPIWVGASYQTRTVKLMQVPVPKVFNGAGDAYVDLDLLVLAYR